MRDSNNSSGGDRRLGDEWRDWDGESRLSTTANKSLFFQLSGALLMLAAFFALAGWYLVSPRISEWWRLAPDILLLLILWGILFFSSALLALALLQWRRRPFPRPLLAFTLRILSWTERGVLILGCRLRIDRDRIMHSIIKVHNSLMHLSEHPHMPENVLLLLPRCLSREHLKAAREVAQKNHVQVAVVPGGELARKRIAQYRPEAIIGVACERDLISGIHDVGYGRCILGIPNNRPHGPCKDTSIDIRQLEDAVSFCIHGRCGDEGGAAAPATGGRGHMRPRPISESSAGSIRS